MRAFVLLRVTGNAIRILFDAHGTGAYTGIMKRFDQKQREVVADFFKKAALMATAALIFGQFVPGEEINWWVIGGGTVVSLIAIFLAALFSRERKDHGIIH